MAGVRGYASWNPKPEAIYWVQRSLDVFNAYRDYWPLSIRQLFYRLVAEHEYEKTEAGYSKLTQLISRARRAGYVPWDAVRDGGLGRTVAPNFFDGADHFERSIRKAAENLHLDRQRDQESVIELWCEAGGMVPILEGIADPYSARVNTGGGYDSVTAKHRLAERVRDRAALGLRTVILHVGDFDGSGEDMCEVLRDDTRYMVVTQVFQGARRCWRGDGKDASLWQDAPWSDWLDEAMGEPDEHAGKIAEWALDFFAVERVALTGQQVIDRNVETAPPKRSDSRTTEFIERNYEVVEALGTENISAQLEALTPPELEALISGAIEEQLDMDTYNAVLAEEEDVRADLLERLDRGKEEES